MVMKAGEAFLARPSMPLPLLQLLLLFFFFFFSLLLLAPSLCSAQGGNLLASDALALLAFIHNLTIVSSGSRAQLSSWSNSSTSSVCSAWVGVTCSSVSGQQRVSELHLPGKSLYGRIPPDTLSRLDALNTLSLRSNKLTGGFPPDIANLSSLRLLSLQANDLSGFLPSDFSPWPLLSQLDLSSNVFSGPIPSSLNSLTRLKALYLQNNLLRGAIPPLSIASLDVFNVSNNELNGSIPESLARFPASSFTGNDDLCGAPLAEECVGTGTTQEKGNKKKLSKWAIVGIVCGAAGAALLLLLLLLLVCVCVSKRKKERRRRLAQGRGIEGEVMRSVAGGGDNDDEQAKRESSAREVEEQRNRLVFIEEKKRLFDLEDLLRASAEVLGKGTLGTSYKAVLEDGLIVAVKRLRDIDETRREEYRLRIHAIGSLRHDNVVPLRAYYFDKDENLLVYDFMQNGSLSALLHGSRATGLNALDWDVRMRIAASAARGLAFIHAHNNMVHGNIKSSNVLLKSNLEACLADYGLSPLLLPSPAAGHDPKPIGYVAPEITDPRSISPKADVFSFGVLLLELLTGKIPLVSSSSTPRPSSSAPPNNATTPPFASPMARIDDDPFDLPRWVQSVVREEWTAEVFDPMLVHSGQTFNEEEMVQLLQVAMSCVSTSPDQRPSMPDVVRMIDNIHRATDDEKSSDSDQDQQYHASTSGQS